MDPDGSTDIYQGNRGRFEAALRRTSGAAVRAGNAVRLLRNGRATYEEWLTEIAGARRWVHLENYIFRDDHVGELFAEALCERASAGVAVRVLVDWFGSWGVAGSFWTRLRSAGVDLRLVNPPSLARPLAVIRRDHRKTLCVDGRYASAGGMCIAEDWLERSPKTGLPYRDTAIGIHGPAVADVERAFAGAWDQFGEPLPREERPEVADIPAAGDTAVRVVAQEPGRVRMLRLLGLLAAAAEERLWITDPYFLSVPTLHESLIAAARDGVDVRVLTPGTVDVPGVASLARTGYTSLLEAGVRIWEYGGPMMHAKTSVVDGWSSRVGSTNMNVTGLLTNWELDVIVEDRPFGARMEEMFEDDLAEARPVVLRPGGRLSPPPPRDRPRRHHAGGRERTRKTGVRAVAAAATTGGAVITGEALTRNERRVAATISGGLVAAAVAGARYPRLLAWPLAAAAGLLGTAGLRSLLRAAIAGPPRR
jgi:cardiolipin synthase A/B